jgi:hypothetical protein
MQQIGYLYIYIPYIVVLVSNSCSHLAFVSLFLHYPQDLAF